MRPGLLLPGLLGGLALVCFVPPASAAPCVATGGNLDVNGITCQLGGVQTYGTVTVRNGGVIQVVTYNGADKVNTGNLELRATSISVDASSSITAVGRGYQTRRCDNGTGPTATAGGRGGCMVRDSGGGGAHFGGGGRGTKDCNNTACGSNATMCEFPGEFEEACGPQLNAAGTACTSGAGTCWTCDALPSVAGVAYWHSIYDVEFGASGADKGCHDGDGFGSQVNAAGPGGGRIVLAAVDGAGTGAIDIQGKVISDGRRGCGDGNDSAGGGAGGTVFIVGDQVTIGPGAVVTSAGGLGGDTQNDATGVCSYAQQGGTCDDCGGGGGGGLVSVLSIVSNISDTAVFNVDGGLGGVCTICRGEAGGGVGELQIAGGFVGELCDGYDNDFDGSVDEGLPVLNCAGSTMPSCVGGLPQTCPVDPSCPGPVTDTRARFLIIVDTSGSMLTDLGGTFTFGDGSTGHAGVDTDGDGSSDDSRLYRAKQALTTVIAGYPEIDFALARYHQDQAVNRSCQLAHWFECHDICCTYDNPTNNTGSPPTPACAVDAGAAGSLTVTMESPGDECINYAGTCGPPERGADILVGFGSDINQYLMWLDHRETNFVDDETEGDYCDFSGGGDCELRGTGPTPLAGSLQAAEDYLAPIIGCDAAASGGCRSYKVILLTDGAESCQGNPTSAAASLLANAGVETFVVGFSVLASEEAQLDAIAHAGSVSGTRDAFLVGDEDELANALASIVSDSIVFEVCDDDDNDCDGLIDEDFPDKGDACDDGEVGICRGTGTRVCNAAQDGTECMITDPGMPSGTESCNGLDDDCDTLVDEGLTCVPDCTPTGQDLCDGVDNDCDNAIDEDDPAVGQPCGETDVGRCDFGTNVCIAGGLECVGEVPPGTEVCNGLDDDCDGNADETFDCPGATSCVEGGCRIPCAGDEFDCPAGFDCVTTPEGRFCVPSPCAACAANETCINDECVDLCEDVTCAANEECRQGNCFDCHVLGGCAAGEVCFDGECVSDPCDAVDCDDDASCINGVCVPDCDDALCDDGQLCTAAGECEDDACAGVECTGGRICVDGSCVADPCRAVSCGPGRVCAGGECIADPCPRVHCSPNRHCEVDDDGAPRCVSDGEVREPEYVQPAGGGGCDCDGGGGAPGGGAPGGGALAIALACLVAIGGRHRRLAALALAAALPLFGCNLEPFAIGGGVDGLGDAGPGNTDARAGDGDGGGGPDAACVPVGLDDTCDEIDNDCNGVVDDDFDKMNDDENCGACGHRCTAPGAILDCEAGECVFVECQPGFVNLDPTDDDCEYQCPLFPPQSEQCNGVDDDCDGTADEVADLPPPPAGMCRTTAGTPCAGVSMVCDTRGTPPVTRWYCAYPADVEFDPTVPNGIVLQETLCDGLDGDCDGVADDPFTDLGNECDNGARGICRDGGVRACDPVDPTQTYCDLSVLPDPIGTATAEVCNGLDDNCDGVIDNPTGADRVIDDMVHITHSGNDFFIYRYEASRPDAAGAAQGSSTARACSNPAVLPWRGATYAVAAAACQVSGKRLCTSDEYLAACAGGSGNAFPYGNTFDPASCNAEPYDGIPGGADDDVLLPAGSVAACTSEDGVVDLSGNLKEWTNDITGQTSGGVDIAVLRGGDYTTPAAGATCSFRTSRAAIDTILPNIGFRCCSDSTP